MSSLALHLSLAAARTDYKTGSGFIQCISEEQVCEQNEVALSIWFETWAESIIDSHGNWIFRDHLPAPGLTDPSDLELIITPAPESPTWILLLVGAGALLLLKRLHV